MQLKISNVQISCQILSLVAARAYVIMLFAAITPDSGAIKERKNRQCLQ